MLADQPAATSPDYEIFNHSLAQLRSSRTSVKWRLRSPGVLPLWIAEMDARPCPAVVAAVSDAVQRGDTGYGWAPPYVEAFVGFARRRWNWMVERSSVLVVPDVLSGLGEVVRRFVQPAGIVIVSPPCYDMFYAVGTRTGRQIVETPLSDDGRLDFEAIDVAFAEAVDDGRPACYLLCNPQNPTSTLHTFEELTKLAELSSRYGVPVISDEIHGPLTQSDEQFTPYLTVAGSASGVSVTSAAKGWNLASFKAALIVAGDEAKDRLGNLGGLSGSGLSHLGLLAQTAAFNDGEAWLDQALAEIARNYSLVATMLESELPDVRFDPLPSTYLMWLDCRCLGLRTDPSDFFRQVGGVALGRGSNYGTPGEGFARMNIATSPEVLTEAITRMSRAARRI